MHDKSDKITRGAQMKVDEERARYVVTQLDQLHVQIKSLIDLAETLLGAFDEMDRQVTNVKWSARKTPQRKKGKR